MGALAHLPGQGSDKRRPDRHQRRTPQGGHASKSFRSPASSAAFARWSSSYHPRRCSDSDSLEAASA
jgi:hypothetical protein